MMRERRSEWNSFELPKGTNSPIGPFYRRLVPPLWIPAPSCPARKSRPCRSNAEQDDRQDDRRTRPDVKVDRKIASHASQALEQKRRIVNHLIVEVRLGVGVGRAREEHERSTGQETAASCSGNEQQSERATAASRLGQTFN